MHTLKLVWQVGLVRLTTNLIVAPATVRKANFCGYKTRFFLPTPYHRSEIEPFGWFYTLIFLICVSSAAIAVKRQVAVTHANEPMILGSVLAALKVIIL